jgi:hypothetical protein
MFNIIVRAAALAALLALLPGSAWCAAPPRVLSTGIGKSERVSRTQYSTLLVFAEARGPYVANVKVEIKDAQGQVVIRMTSEGPLLYMALAPGAYQAVATRSGGRKSQAAFTVTGDRQQTVYLTW